MTVQAIPITNKALQRITGQTEVKLPVCDGCGHHDDPEGYTKTIFLPASGGRHVCATCVAEAVLDVIGGHNDGR